MYKRQVEYDGNIDFSEYDYIIDAIFGIGLSRAVEGRYAQVIEAINKARENPDTKIIAVDIASGISADNGQIMGIAVKADYTITFGYNKTGIMFYPGASYLSLIHIYTNIFQVQCVQLQALLLLMNQELSVKESILQVRSFLRKLC